jgi:hypothetical protein
MTAGWPNLVALRSRAPYFGLGDRGASRIDDLFTVGLLSSYIVQKLGGDGQGEPSLSESERTS